MRQFTIESLAVKIFDNKNDLGKAAADFAAEQIDKAVREKGTARVIFATGASQFEFLSAVVEKPVQWSQVHAFHLDEYIGLPTDHPASFRRYLRERLFDRVRPGQVCFLDGNATNLEAECERYGARLREAEIDLACIGIGENGHIAFNDPPVADFNDPRWVKPVELDEPCRKQQFGEGWFASLDAVPRTALSLTIPAILSSRRISCVVPDARKAQAVRNTLQGPIHTACPASILRTHPDTVLWLDQAAATLLS